MFLILGDKNREQREEIIYIFWRRKYRKFDHKDSRPTDLKSLIQNNKILVIKCYNICSSAKYHDMPQTFEYMESINTTCPLLSCA